MAFFFDVKQLGISQGSIGSSGDTTNATRVRTTGRYAVDSMISKRVIVSAVATTGKALQYDICGYTNSSTNTFAFDYYWYDVNTLESANSFTIRNDPTAYYIRCILKYADGSDITPEEIESWTIEIHDLWNAEDGEYPQNYMIAEGYTLDSWVEPYPVMAWRAANGESPHLASTILKETDLAFSLPYPYGYWRIDDSNNGYPYTDLLHGVPRVVPPDPEPPTPPEPEYEEAITMQYDIYCDGQLMHSTVTPEKEWKVIDPVLDLQDSAAGSLEFTLPPFNCMYGKCQMMMSTISVRRNGVEIWEGRPVSFKEDMWLNHVITCEGELAYLNDIYQAQHKYENVALEPIINGLLIEYNKRAAANRQFTVGFCEMPDIQSDKIEVIIPFESTLQAINDLCKTYNMHIYMANTWVNGVKTRKISFYRDSGQLLGNNATQKIEIGRNLTDYAKSYNFSSLVTAILPLGAKSNKAGSTQKDDDAEIDILTTSITQGTIKSDGTNDDADNRVRTGFINITSGADTVSITATGVNVPPGQTLQFALELYSGNTVDTFVHEYKEGNIVWFDMPKEINVASYGATHARLVFRFSGDNDILPDYITSGTMSVTKTRHGEPYAKSGDSNQRYGRGYVIWPSNGYDKRDEQHRQLHDAGDIVDITDIPDFDTHETGFSRNRYFVYKYTITEKNATVFIDTQMKMGAGMVVVYNNNSKYYIKKSNKNGNTVWDDMKFSGWYEGFTGDVTMYVGGYDTTSASGEPTNLTVYNSKIVDKGLEEYVTVENIGGEGVSENINGLYVIDNTGAAVGQRPIDIYGRIEKKIDWSDVKDSWTLYQNAITYLRSDQFDGLQIDLTAMDLSMLGFNATQLRVGEKVNVVAPVYGLNTEMPVTSIKLPLNRPEDATYTVGSKRKQTLTSVNSSTNTELLSLIAEKPDMSTVLKTAKKSAAEYLLDTQNGYVTMRYGENGHPEAIIISDNEDYTMSSAGYWIFGKHGIGFIKAGDDEAEAYTEATVAMRSDGQIVANYITAGTMVADRIRGGTMSLGYWPDESGTYRSGGFTVRGASGNTILQVDDQNYVLSKEDTNTNANWIKVHDHRITFGKDNDGESSDDNRAHIIGGDPVQGSSKAIGIHCDRLLFGSENIWVRTWSNHSTSGSNPYHYAPGWYPVSDEFQEVRTGNYSHVFFQGILIDSHNIGSSYPTTHFKVGDTTYYFEDGLLVRTETDSNNE